MEWIIKRASNYGLHFLFCFDQGRDFINLRLDENAFRHKILFSMEELIWMLNILDVPTAEQWAGLAVALVGSSLAIRVKHMSPVVGAICLVSVV